MVASELDARSYELAHKEDLLEQVSVNRGEAGRRIYMCICLEAEANRLSHAIFVPSVKP